MANKINQASVSLTNPDNSQKSKLTLGCSWGMEITKTMITVVDDNGFYGIGRKTHKEHQRLSVDLDLSCIFIDNQGQICDHLYSTKFKKSLLRQYNLPSGRFDAKVGYAHHSGDDICGSRGEENANDNEMISMDLSTLEPQVKQIVFFLNNTGHGTLDKIPFIKIHLGETESTTTLWEIDAAKLHQCRGKKALVIGKVSRKNTEWQYLPIEEAFEDEHLCETIKRILNTYL